MLWNESLVSYIQTSKQTQFGGFRPTWQLRLRIAGPGSFHHTMSMGLVFCLEIPPWRCLQCESELEGQSWQCDCRAITRKTCDVSLFSGRTVRHVQPPARRYDLSKASIGRTLAGLRSCTLAFPLASHVFEESLMIWFGQRHKPVGRVRQGCVQTVQTAQSWNQPRNNGEEFQMLLLTQSIFSSKIMEVENYPNLEETHLPPGAIFHLHHCKATSSTCGVALPGQKKTQ